MLTMMALNTCIVSVSEVVHYADRLVLDREYRNIINNISFGNIKADEELVVLFQSLLTALSEGMLLVEEKDAFLRSYDRGVKKALVDSLSNAAADGKTPYEALLSGAWAAGTVYFDHRNRIEDYRTELGKGLWGLNRERREQLNELQRQLLSASWKLQRRYDLPDRLRITQEALAHFQEVLDDRDASRRLRRLERMEKEFGAYPPYWYIRGKAAQDQGLDEEALEFYGTFEQNWRPILRHDPFYAATAMNRAYILGNRERAEIIRNLEILLAQSGREDGLHFLFAGLRFLQLGERDRARACFQRNVDEKFEPELNRSLLQDLGKEKLCGDLAPALEEQIDGLTRRIIDENGLRNQDLLLLYDREGDEKVLSRIEKELGSIRLELVKRRAQRDTVALGLPRRWVTGTASLEKDNHFSLAGEPFSLALSFEKGSEIARFSPADVSLLKKGQGGLTPRGGDPVIGFDQEMDTFVAYVGGDFPSSLRAVLEVIQGEETLTLLFEGKKEDPRLFSENRGGDYAVPVLGQIKLLGDLLHDSTKLVTEAIAYETGTVLFRGRSWSVREGKLVPSEKNPSRP
jgi:hypothetical protein